MEVLSLVDVNKDTASQTWPLLLEAINTAHFTALDLELSGLGNVIGRGKGVNIETRYSDACETARTRAMLSLGLACFRWKYPPPSNGDQRTVESLPQTTKDSGCNHSGVRGESGGVGVEVEVQVFNVWLMRQTAYTVDPSSAQFLLQHGFDFNKQVAKGIPYTPGQLQVKEEEMENVSLHNLFTALLLRGKPLVVHNGWIDLLFLYGNLYAPLPPSLGTLAADMSEMFVGGVYDTKAIATYEILQEATFLEYLFRKCQRDNEVAMTRGSPHLLLQQTPLSSCVQTESVPLSPSEFPSLEESANVKVCTTFATAGYCHQAKCSLSHDVLIVLAQREQALQIKQMKRRKRKRVDSKQIADQDDGCKDCSSETGDEARPSLAKQFVAELESARLTLAAAAKDSSQTSVSSGPGPTSTTSVECPTSTECKPSHSGPRPSYGHRAGFDAFMTGYVFTHFALTTTKLPFSLSSSSSSPDFDEAMITGLSSMKNKLGNRSRPVPLILAKSEFEKTSPAHRDNWTKIQNLK